MNVNTNVNSLLAQTNLSTNGKAVAQAMERLSSGLRINNASDDAAGLAISERMNAQVNGMEQALSNAQDGISLAQTAEGALGTVSDIIQRMKTLAVQAENGIYTEGDDESEGDIGTINDEIEALTDEIKRIAQEVTFNGKTLLDSGDSVKIHVTDQPEGKIDIELVNITDLFEGGLEVGVGDDGAAIAEIDKALDEVNEARAGLGAQMNRLEFVAENLRTSINNTSESKSRIQDADMAKEMSELTRAEILQNTTLAMLPRANSHPQSVIQLLQG